MWNKDFCNAVMSSEHTKMLASFIIYADLECLIEKELDGHN